MSITCIPDDSPFFSVVVPTYNRAAFIPSLIRSLTSQTFRSLEVIVVDDGSTDDTREVVLSLSQGDPRIIYLHQDNSERGAARNNGISHSTGKWISFLDSDDVYMTNHFQVLFDYISENLADGIIAFNYLIQHASGDLVPGITNISPGIVDPSILLRGNPFACNFAIENSSRAFKLFQVDKSLVTMEDWIFLVQNTQYYSLHLLPQVTVVLNQHPGRSMNDNQRVIRARFNAMNFLVLSSTLSAVKCRAIVAYSYLFCAIHSYLDSQRCRSLLYFCMASTRSFSILLRVDILVKFLLGRDAVCCLKSLFSSLRFLAKSNLPAD